MTYKVGDKVRIVSKWTAGCFQNLDGKMDKYLGTIMTIRKVEGDHYLMIEDSEDRQGYGWNWNEPAIAGLVVAAPFMKKDLKNGDIVLQRNGVVQIYIDSLNVFAVRDGGWNDVDKYDDDLTRGGQFDIIAVRRPRGKCECVFDAFERALGELVYDRKRDTVVEMTMAEICAALGKTIKIVKE